MSLIKQSLYEKQSINFKNYTIIRKIFNNLECEKYLIKDENNLYFLTFYFNSSQINKNYFNKKLYFCNQFNTKLTSIIEFEYDNNLKSWYDITLCPKFLQNYVLRSNNFIKTGFLNDILGIKNIPISFYDLISSLHSIIVFFHNNNITNLNISFQNIIIENLNPINLILNDSSTFTADDNFSNQYKSKDYYDLGILLLKFILFQTPKFLHDIEFIINNLENDNYFLEKILLDIPPRQQTLIKGLITSNSNEQWQKNEVNAWLFGVSPKNTYIKNNFDFNKFKKLYNDYVISKLLINKCINENVKNLKELNIILEKILKLQNENKLISHSKYTFLKKFFKLPKQLQQLLENGNINDFEFAITHINNLCAEYLLIKNIEFENFLNLVENKKYFLELIETVDGYYMIAKYLKNNFDMKIYDQLLHYYKSSKLNLLDKTHQLIKKYVENVLYKNFNLTLADELIIQSLLNFQLALILYKKFELNNLIKNYFFNISLAIISLIFMIFILILTLVSQNYIATLGIGAVILELIIMYFNKITPNEIYNKYCNRIDCVNQYYLRKENYKINDNKINNYNNIENNKKLKEELFESITLGNKFKLNSLLKNIDNNLISNIYFDEINYTTPLMYSIINQSEEIFTTLLELESENNLTKTNIYGETILHLAVIVNNHLFVNKILKKNTELINLKDNFDRHPLAIACFNGNVEIVKLLVELSDFSKIYDNNSNGILWYAKASGNTTIEKIITNKILNKNITEKNIFYKIFDIIIDVILDKLFLNCLDVIENIFIFLKSIITLDLKLFKNFLSPKQNSQFLSNIELFEALKQKNINNILQLIKNGCNINIKDKNGYTPLIIAIKNNQNNIVEMLLNNKADINLKDDCYMQTPLMWAILKNNLNVITKLLKFENIDINATNYKNMTALSLAVINENIEVIKLLLEKKALLDLVDTQNYNPLSYAVIQNNKKIVEILIDHSTSEILDNLLPMPLIFWTIKNNYLDILEKIIKKGININIYDNLNQTPLIYAINNYNADAVKLLVKYRANINVYNSKGQSAFILSILNNLYPITQILVENGANINETYNNFSALFYAVKTKNINLIKLLLEHKANINNCGPNGESIFDIITYDEKEILYKLIT